MIVSPNNIGLLTTCMILTKATPSSRNGLDIDELVYYDIITGRSLYSRLIGAQVGRFFSSSTVTNTLISLITNVLKHLPPPVVS